ncbi:MAG: EamA family transporter [Phyllobacteriaceae bacterium]|nr:EamA family transporter [Phyllobacteriaceae bacterium]
MKRATAIGFLAIIMWSLLALLTAGSGKTPPFQLAAITFAIGTGVGVAAAFAGFTGGSPRSVRPVVWVLGIGGLFGYHFFYFTALRHAPPVEASLIAYLWPLFIVFGSALFPGERLGWHHLAGAAIGLLGTALIVTGGKGFSPDPRHSFGYAMAFGCAFLWSGYSLAMRRFAAAPTGAVTVFCAATAILSAIAHLGLEETVWPVSAAEWWAILGLGLMPVGAAFYVWDHGVKRGDIRVLGAASYAAPLLSTLALIAAGRAQATGTIALACVMIAGGAALAAKDMFKPARANS